ncbi:MAG TPA: flavin monoamine oxidase family protein [Herpetosiphonaceae bacterium]|nr:flavin monoamine oxidase family protein [Herpetosiphonaceae bacterium]
MAAEIPGYLDLIERGLPATTVPRKVVVVGAGMAGLVAAYELQRAGHEPILLEARHRIGGRVYTMRDPFAPGLHAEAGAMRVPSAHKFTMAYIRKFQLQLLPFTMNNFQAYHYVRDRQYRIADAAAQLESLGFDLAPHEIGKSHTRLWEDTIHPIQQRIEQEGEAAWDAIYAEYDRVSTREFLEASNWSEGAIEMYGLLCNQEARMHSSFGELLRSELSHSFVDMHQLAGGTDRLPHAFLPTLQRHIRFGARVTAIDQSPDTVTVYYQTLADRTRVKGDYAIMTLPLTVLRHIELLKPFSRAKQRAIRELNYDASGKVFLQCRRRFWEEDEGIYGGGTITDLPIRNIYYPDHGRETERGVLIGSYTWGKDAQRWSYLDPTARVIQTFDQVAQIHPQVLDEFEVGASHMWQNDEYAGGAFALFEPGQQTRLHQHIISPEGRIHFAGEHASLAHRWIQGAIESGLRAALEVHRAASVVQ